MNQAQKNEARLQRAYGRPTPAPAPPSDDFAAVAKKYGYLVHRWARRYSRTSGGIVDWDDLVSVGMMGLLQAKMRYATDSSRPFETYAEFRIKGAILDELRRVDTMSQPLRKKMRDLSTAFQTLANELGRPPDEGEIAKALGVPLAHVQRLRRQEAERSGPRSADYETVELKNDLMMSGWTNEDLKLALREAIVRLDKRTQTVLQLYYFEGFTMREIGEAVELTEARVSQLHKAALALLRKRLRDLKAVA